MTTKDAASLALGIALGVLMFGALRLRSHDLGLIAIGTLGVLVAGIWRLRH